MTMSGVRQFGLRDLLVLSLTMALIGLCRGGLAEEDYSEPEAEDFAYPVPWLKTGPVKDRMYYASHRNLLLRAGWSTDSEKALKTANDEFAAAQKLCPNDPRLEYAMGLALWNHGRRDEAVRWFDISARLDRGMPPFLPAAQAAAWSRLVIGERDAGLRQVVLTARALGQSRGDYPTQIQREHSALFLGRATGYLSGPGFSIETAESDKRSLDEIASLIPTDLKPLFDKGHGQIVERHQELINLAARPADEVESEFRRKLDELKSRETQNRNEIEGIDKTLDVRSRQQRDWLRQQQAKLDQAAQQVQLALFDANNAAAIVCLFTRPEKHYEYRSERVRKVDKNDNSYYVTEKRRVERNETCDEKAERLRKLARARAHHDAMLARLHSAKAKWLGLESERRASMAAFPVQQKELRTARSHQNRQMRETMRERAQFEEDFVDPQKLAAVIGTIAPYVPWDVDAERDGLKASYRITLAETSLH